MLILRPRNRRIDMNMQHQLLSPVFTLLVSRAHVKLTDPFARICVLANHTLTHTTGSITHSMSKFAPTLASYRWSVHIDHCGDTRRELSSGKACR